MDRSEIKPYIARRAAKELHDGDIVNLGIGLPTMVPKYLPENVEVTLHAENGMIGVSSDTEKEEPLYITDAGGKPSAVKKGGAFIDSAVSFGLVRGGHVDVTILGALQVDQEGNLSNWIIPGKMVPGMGGAMDLVVGAKKVIVAMEHTNKGKLKILEKNTLPYTAVKCVNMIITEMGVMEVTPVGLLLTEYNPEFTLEEIQGATGAKLNISTKLKTMS